MNVINSMYDNCHHESVLNVKCVHKRAVCNMPCNFIYYFAHTHVKLINQTATKSVILEPCTF